MSEVGKGAYLKNLEKARKAALDSAGSRFKVETAQEQVEIAKDGLMRPKARPTPEATEPAVGFGLALMRSLRPEARPEGPAESLRPNARPEGGLLSGLSDDPKFKGETQTGDHAEPGSFVSKLIQSESGGNSKAEITIKDGRRFVGAGQFGKARLADYKRATGASFTQNEFQNDGDLQAAVMDWHIKDIDRAIDAAAGSDRFSRDGLRAVAHLGGIGGMRKYVESNGRYNPSDELGTTLSKYYNKFR